jgi:hypothetical protein
MEGLCGMSESPQALSALHPDPLLSCQKGGKALRQIPRPFGVPCMPAPAALSFGRHKPPTGRLVSGLSARNPGTDSNSLRSLRSLRSNSESGLVVEACFASPRVAARFGGVQMAETAECEQPAANSRTAPYFQVGASPSIPQGERVVCNARRFLAAGRLAARLLPRPEALSSTASPGAGASPPPQLTPPNCLNGTSAASGVSFGRAWACEQRKEPRRGAEAGGAVLVPFAKTRGTPGAGRKAPAGCTANHHIPNTARTLQAARPHRTTGQIP